MQDDGRSRRYVVERRGARGRMRLNSRLSFIISHSSFPLRDAFRRWFAQRAVVDQAHAGDAGGDERHGLGGGDLDVLQGFAVGERK